VNFFKGKIYMADFTIGINRFQNYVQMSSPALGLISLVEGDYAIGSTTLKVSDTKYIRATDSLEVYRGNTLIQTLTVSGKTETDITVTATTSALRSSDELWVVGTKLGTSKQRYRWVDSPAIGTDLKRYDTFPLSGGTNSPILMLANVGDNMAVSTKDNFAFWNGYSLQVLDTGIGCCSPNGFVRSQGYLFFMGYKGLYMTDGATAPRLISTAVDRYFQGATTVNLEQGAMGAKGFSIFATLGDVTLYNEDGSVDKVLTNVCVEYDIRKDSSYVHTNFDTIYFASYSTSTDTDKLVVAIPGSGVNEVFLSGTETDYTTHLLNPTEIPFRIDTQPLQLAEPGGSVEILQVRARVDRGTNIQVFVSMDDEPFYELSDSLKKGWSSVAVNGKNKDRTSPARCSNIRISLRDSSKSKCKISQLEVIYRPYAGSAEDLSVDRELGIR
jgi:hypothetical protein